MGKYAFHKDQPDAQIWEEKVAKWLESRGAEIISMNNDNKHDIVYKKNGKVLTMEVKHDILSSKTGNVAIEFKSWGKPSGICTSIADFWCQIVEDKYYYIVDRPTLIYHILRGNFPVKSGGDEGKTYMYIIKMPDFAKFCNVHGDEALVDEHELCKLEVVDSSSTIST